MLKVLAIACGGAMGALARYWMTTGIYHWLGREFPIGTLAVNVLGSLVMGVAFAYLLHRADPDSVLQPLIVAGLLGAFTTFSTFSLETVLLFEAGAPGRALVNVAASVVLCIVACWLGLLAGRHLFAMEA